MNLGDSLISTPSIIHPAYLGQATSSLTSISIFDELLFLNEDISGNITSSPVAAFISLATPRCDAASALFGVREISNVVSFIVSKYLDALSPILA
jgi:hypothetical protein